MTNNAPDTARSTGKTYIRDLGNGIKLTAEVSPCVFMYPPYPLQITITLHRHSEERLGNAITTDQTKTAANFTDATVEQLLASVQTVPCSACSTTPAFDPATVETNRAGLCETCFEDKLRAEWAAEEKAEHTRIAAHDRRMMQKGMTVRVTAWVHPQLGGDDYEVAWYFKALPTPQQVSDLLRKEGSSIFNDYQIINL